METLGYKRPPNVQAKIEHIINHEGSKFFGIKKATRDLYVIYNKATGKVISDRPRPRGKSLKMLKEFE